jgi:hypothetical protein
MTGGAFAQTSTTTTSFAENFSADIDAYSESVRNSSNSLQDLKTWADLNAYYMLTPNDRLTVRNTFKHQSALVNNQFTYEAVELHYRRKNILSQEDFGVNVQADLRAKYTVDAAIREGYQNYGGVHGRLYVQRQMTNQLSLSGKARYDFFFRYKATPESYDKLFLLDASADYAFNDQWTASLFTEYTNLIPVDVSPNKVALKIEPGVKYSFSGSTYLKAYSGIVPVKNNDNEGWRDDSFNKAYFGLNLFSQFM